MTRGTWLFFLGWLLIVGGVIVSWPGHADDVLAASAFCSAVVAWVFATRGHRRTDHTNKGD